MALGQQGLFHLSQTELKYSSQSRWPALYIIQERPLSTGRHIFCVYQYHRAVLWSLLFCPAEIKTSELCNWLFSCAGLTSALEN